jgi:hypothetical protein
MKNSLDLVPHSRIRISLREKRTGMKMHWISLEVGGNDAS